MGYKEIYNEWLTNAYFDADTKAELERIASDENEIKERFYTDLEFGTADFGELSEPERTV